MKKQIIHRSKLSEEHKIKIANALKGNKNGLGHKISPEHRAKLNLYRKMKGTSDETRRNISVAQKGKSKPKRGEDFKEKMRIIAKERVTKGTHNWWKGGVTPINQLIRCSAEYKLWRKAVFERDRWTCIFCGYKGSKIEADHIKRFSEYPELRFAIDNGRTLCKECHKNTHNWGNYKKIV